MVTARSAKAEPVRSVERLRTSDDGQLRLAVVSDTHSVPHPRTLEVLSNLHPNAILHAGDVGDLRVLDSLATVCPVFAVCGNIDSKIAGLPEQLIVEIGGADQLLLRLLMLHVGVYGPKLRADVARLARAEKASLIVCGHSHVPFIGVERGLSIFNPGSVGPRRFGLPIVFGTIDINPQGVRLSHVDCETGTAWEPPVLGRL